MRSITLTEREPDTLGEYSPDQLAQMLAQKRRERLAAFQVELNELLEQYKVRLVPQCLIVGGQIVSHDIGIVDAD